jgi:hypothetical protein
VLEAKMKSGKLRDAVMALIALHTLGYDYLNHYARRYSRGE